MTEHFRVDHDESDRLVERITSHADDHETNVRGELRRARTGLNRTRGRGGMAAAVEGAADQVLKAIQDAEDQLHKHLKDVSEGVQRMNNNHRANDKALETMLNSIVKRSKDQDALQRKGGVGISGPNTSLDAETITLKWLPGMDKQQFERKARALQRLGKDGNLFKYAGKTQEFRDKKITADYRGALQNILRGKYEKSDPEFNEKVLERLKDMQPDHVHELQVGGQDSWKNLKMLETFTNYEIGTKQIRPAIKDLAGGTPIKIDIKWWPDE